jgi:hypothetical protein
MEERDCLRSQYNWEGEQLIDSRKNAGKKNVHMERQKQSAKKSRVHILGVFVLREKRERTGKKVR